MDLKKYYIQNAIPVMKKQFGYVNDLAVPKILKVSINVCFGKSSKDQGDQSKTKVPYKDMVERHLQSITGQKPITTKALRSIAGFGLREGSIIGAKVTLRGGRMYDFLGRLIHIALPRIRDFQGISPSSLDNCGNLTIGFKEHIVFPEVNAEDIKEIHGLEVSIATTAKKKKEALELFKLMGFPFKAETADRPRTQ